MWPIILTFNLDIESVKMNQHTKYLALRHKGPLVERLLVEHTYTGPIALPRQLKLSVIKFQYV